MNSFRCLSFGWTIAIGLVALPSSSSAQTAPRTTTQAPTTQAPTTTAAPASTPARTAASTGPARAPATPTPVATPTPRAPADASAPTSASQSPTTVPTGAPAVVTPSAPTPPPAPAGVVSTSPSSPPGPPNTDAPSPSAAEGPEGSADDRETPGHGAGPGRGSLATPHAQTTPEDISRPDASVPAGSVQVLILDEAEQPRPGQEVELIESFESVAQGKKETSRKAKTDAQGMVRFDGLSSELSYSYSVVTERDGGVYGVAPFRLKQNRGQKVQLHAYPTTSDPRDAFVGMRGFVFIQPRDDVFQIEVLFRVLNMSRTSWVPRDVVMELPKEFQAFEGPTGAANTRFEQAPEGARLMGTFAPGQADVRYSFQVPSHHSETQKFELSLPPHVAELRVLTVAAPSMTLDVDGFEPSQKATGPTGDRVLITRKLMRPGQDALDRVSIRVGGLPVKSDARWFAVLAALALAAAGLVVALQRHGQKGQVRHFVGSEDLDRARTLLLEEIVAVDRAFAEGVIGPRTHESTKRRLLDALARLELVPLSSDATRPSKQAATT